jgi:hypothetical protein
MYTIRMHDAENIYFFVMKNHYVYHELYDLIFQILVQ